VDINFGCSNGSICRQNCGAALLNEPGLAASIVAAVREAVSFPVTVKFRTGWKDDPRIAAGLAKSFEGDVFDRNDCREMIQKTGCDGVALGRAAIAKPWIFAEWIENMEPAAEIYLDAALQLASLLVKHYDSRNAIRRFKRFAFYFAANFRYAHTLHSRILKAGNMQEVESILHRFFHQPADLVSRPNLNFFG
jgi:tRNA-dihydrouridine synthase